MAMRCPAVAPVPKPARRFARYAAREAMTWVILFATLGILRVRAQSEPIRLADDLSLKWGTVTLPATGQTLDTWYAETPPGFLAEPGPPGWSPDQFRCLQRAFEILEADADGRRVHRFSRGLLTLEFTRVLSPENHCFASVLFSLGDFPANWTPGTPETRTWRFRLTLRPLATQDHGTGSLTLPPPDVEILLRCDRIPDSTALELPLDLALSDPEVRRRSGLSSERLDALRPMTSWVRVFLVPPQPSVTLSRNSLLPDLGAHQTPAAFAVLALDRVESILGSDRRYTPDRQRELSASLSPPPAGSLLAARAFFPDLCRRELGNPPADDLEPTRIQVGFSQEGALNSTNSPVTRRWNVWRVAAGPFPWFSPPRVVVERVQGAKEVLTLDDLDVRLADRPGAANRYRQALSITANRLQRRVDDIAGPAAGYFWLPAIESPHRKSLMALRGERFVSSVTPRLSAEGLIYDVAFTYSPMTGELGVTYDATHELGATASLDWNRLFHAADALYSDATLTLNSLEGEAGYRITLTEDLEGRTTHLLNPYARGERDDRFRLGSLSETPFTLTEFAAGLVHEWRHESDPWSVSLRQDARWESFDLDDAAPAGIPEKQSGLLLEHQQTWRFVPAQSPRPRPMTWEFTIRPSIAWGPEAGWDRSFWITEFSLGTRARFGGKSDRDMSAGVRLAAGFSSEGVPHALLFRLGDVDRLPGLEPGEYSGRSYSQIEANYGVGLNYLLGGLFKTPRSDEPKPGDRSETPLDDAEGDSAEPGSNAREILQALSLELIAEAATINESASTDVVSDPNEVISSFAVALSVDPGISRAGIGFRLGYAYSPDSVRRHGRFFASLGWSF